MTSPRSALIVEDDDDVRAWLKSCADIAFDRPVTTLACDLKQARQALDRTWNKALAHGRPALFDLALIDIGLPDGSGIGLIGEIRARDPHCLCVVATIYDDDDNIFAAIEAGADGYVLKYHETERLIDLLRRISQGEPPLSPAVARRVLKALKSRGRRTPAEAPESALTARETEVLSLLGRGFQLSHVAGSLAISHNTASSHVKAIYRKLNISNRAEAAIAAVARGLVENP